MEKDTQKTEFEFRLDGGVSCPYMGIYNNFVFRLLEAS
jgi:hypothetical protein